MNVIYCDKRLPNRGQPQPWPSGARPGKTGRGGGRDAPANMQNAERSLQAHLVRDPSLVSAIESEPFIASLSSDTHLLISLLKEFPYFCEVAGPSAVAEYMRDPEEFVTTIRGLESLPDWAFNTLPSLDAALKVLRSKKLERLGAIEQWRREVSAGLSGQRIDRPSSWIFDPLWEAACYEAAALEADRDGLHGLADGLMQRAATTMTKKAA